MDRSDEVSEAKSEIKTNQGFWADDGNCEVHYPDAESAYEAAREYVESGDWGEIQSTIWVSVLAWPDGDKDEGSSFDISVDPREPHCIDGRLHDWCSPHKVVGGVRENPGVIGHGGGVLIIEVCRHCGCYRQTNTWAQNPQTGEQGLESVKYIEPDQGSIDWVQEQA